MEMLSWKKAKTLAAAWNAFHACFGPFGDEKSGPKAI
jgi:hypothetical protein